MNRCKLWITVSYYSSWANALDKINHGCRAVAYFGQCN